MKRHRIFMVNCKNCMYCSYGILFDRNNAFKKTQYGYKCLLRQCNLLTTNHDRFCDDFIKRGAE